MKDTWIVMGGALMVAFAASNCGGDDCDDPFTDAVETCENGGAGGNESSGAGPSSGSGPSSGAGASGAGGGSAETPTGPVVQLAAGDAHACAILESGQLVCWGDNSFGEVGNGQSQDEGCDAIDGQCSVPTPTPVEGLGGTPVHVSNGSQHACAVLDTGAVKCWGHNLDGQLGDGGTQHRSLPETVVGLDGSVEKAVQVAAGHFHTCALLEDGNVKCWGFNEVGALGNAGLAEGEISTVPVDASISDVVELEAGQSYTCARLSDGSLSCWGWALSGQLGYGDRDNEPHPNPLPVSGIDGVNARAIGVSAAGVTTCAPLEDGRLQCWGDNQNGQLGLDTGDLFNPLPVTIPGLGGTPIAVDGETGHNCVALAEGGMQCWGRNHFGQLGDGTTQDSMTPVTVQGLPYRVTPASGNTFTCALTDGGAVLCWGRNDRGYLGDGTTTDRLQPGLVQF